MVLVPGVWYGRQSTPGGAGLSIASVAMGTDASAIMEAISMSAPDQYEGTDWQHRFVSDA